MTNRALALFLASVSFAVWPLHAYAQKIPWIVLPLAALPLLAVCLSAVLGVMTKNWMVGLGSTGLVILWVLWFVAASKYSTSDLLVWVPIVALGSHAILIVCVIVLRIVHRARVRNEA